MSTQPNTTAVVTTGRTDSHFDGGVLEFIAMTILAWGLTVITLGIALPWAVCMRESWMAKHTVIEGRRLRFDGNAIGLFATWIKILLLTIITLGIYGFWANMAVKKWIVANTHFE